MSPPAVDPTVAACLISLCRDGILSSVDHRLVVGSTNTEAMNWLRCQQRSVPCSVRSPVDTSDGRQGGGGLPRLVVADRQTAGRGRRGRSWLAQDDGLAFSLVVGISSPLASLAAGLAVCDAIEHLAGPTRCDLKWPNDVWMQERKVAGILVERVDQRDGRLVIGIGINLQSFPSVVPDEQEELPTRPAQPGRPGSVMEATGRLVSRASMLEELTPMLLERLQESVVDPLSTCEAFRTRCCLDGQLVEAVVAGQPASGRCQGIDSMGRLRIETPEGTRLCQTGEVHRVRMS